MCIVKGLLSFSPNSVSPFLMLPSFGHFHDLVMSMLGVSVYSYNSHVDMYLCSLFSVD